MASVFTSENKRGDSILGELGNRARQAAGSSLPLHESTNASAHEGMLIVDRSGRIAPLNGGPGRDWRVPQGGRTVPLNQRFARMWRIPRRLLTKLTMEDGLRRALEREEMAVHFQPQASLESGRIDGAEALIRWQHPHRGLVLPGDFMPLAEETGLIVQLGEWVLLAACTQVKTWQRAGGSPLRVAVNLSTRQLQQPGLVAAVAGVLEQTHLDPGSLELEITESTTMNDADLAIRVLSALRELGVRISMDDFGVGYSSLAHLKDLPLHALKIDRSLVRGITRDPNYAAIVAAIIAMARSLGLEVVAEGVETNSQLAFLREQRCHRFQGYLLGEPMPGEQLAIAGMNSSRSRAA